MSALQLIAPPALEPVSLAAAKAHLRIEHTADDALIADLVTVVRQLAEAYTGRVFISQTWRLLMDEAPVDSLLALPRAPLLGVTSVKTYDAADAATVMSPALYLVDTANQPGRLVLRNGGNWPAPARAAGGFEVTFTAGYGATASDVPLALRQGLLAHLAFLYEHRGEGLSATGDTLESLIPTLALMLYHPYRLLRGVR